MLLRATVGSALPVMMLMILSLTGGSEAREEGWRRPPRGQVSGELNAVMFLDYLASCTTNRTFLQTLVDFSSYGCYCGLGGFGQPVDGVDRCCQIHDECYGATQEAGGACYLNIVTYLIPYKYYLHDCGTDRANVTCAGLDEYHWYNLLPECSVAICECDRDVAMCFAQHTYHEQYRFYNRLLNCFDANDADDDGGHAIQMN